MLRKSPALFIPFLWCALAPLNPAAATGSELHYFAPHQSGVKINKPEMTPVEEKIAALNNLIRALRVAKTARERNSLLNEQQRTLEELSAMIPKSDKAPNQENDRVERLERRVDKLQWVVEQMMRR